MTSKPTCIIVDDEELSLAALKDAIEELGLLEVEKAYIDPDKFLVQLDQLESKIIFLDMEMPISGIEVASKLKDKLVVFVSGYTERGYRTFEVNAIDFVPKPIRLSRLKQAIEKVLNLELSSSLVVKTQDTKKEEITPSDIAYITALDESPRDKEIHLCNGQRLIAKNIKFDEILSQLPPNFDRVDRSTVVNFDYVKKLLDVDTIGLVYPDSGKIKELNLGKSYKDTFFKHKPQFR